MGLDADPGRFQLRGGVLQICLAYFHVKMAMLLHPARMKPRDVLSVATHCSMIPMGRSVEADAHMLRIAERTDSQSAVILDSSASPNSHDLPRPRPRPPLRAPRRCRVKGQHDLVVNL